VCVQDRSLCVILNLKALAASARALDVRIVKDKLGAELALDKVHLGAEERELRLGVHEEPGAALLHHLVEALLLLGVLERVREAVAAALAHAHAQALHVRMLVHELLHALYGAGRERDGRATRDQLAARGALYGLDATGDYRFGHDDDVLDFDGEGRAARATLFGVGIGRDAKAGANELLVVVYGGAFEKAERLLIDENLTFNDCVVWIDFALDGELVLEA